jgi:hypothetical protein
VGGGSRFGGGATGVTGVVSAGVVSCGVDRAVLVACRCGCVVAAGVVVVVVVVDSSEDELDEPYGS